MSRETFEEMRREHRELFQVSDWVHADKIEFC